MENKIEKNNKKRESQSENRRLSASAMSSNLKESQSENHGLSASAMSGNLRESQSENRRLSDKTKKNDFIELEFTGGVKDGEIFDTNKKEDIKKLNLQSDEDIKEKAKPLILCIGQNMILPSFDKALEDKEIEKDYKVDIPTEKAFGKRNPSLIKTMPIRIFLEKNINPQPGMMFALDTSLIKIIAVSGGRVIADFNNPLAGKDICYKFKIKRKVTDLSEKVNALMDFFIKKRIAFEVVKEKDKEVIKIKAEKEKPETINFFKLFQKKFEEILDVKVVIEGEKEKDKKEEKEKEKNEEKKQKQEK